MRKLAQALIVSGGAALLFSSFFSTPSAAANGLRDYFSGIWKGENKSIEKYRHHVEAQITQWKENERIYDENRECRESYAHLQAANADTSTPLTIPMVCN